MEIEIGQRLICRNDIIYLSHKNIFFITNGVRSNNDIAFIKDNLYTIIGVNYSIHIKDEYGEIWYFNNKKGNDYYLYDYFISPSEWRELQINSILDGN